MKLTKTSMLLSAFMIVGYLVVSALMEKSHLESFGALLLPILSVLVLSNAMLIRFMKRFSASPRLLDYLLPALVLFILTLLLGAPLNAVTLMLIGLVLAADLIGFFFIPEKDGREP